MAYIIYTYIFNNIIDLWIAYKDTTYIIKVNNKYI
jgi:hypothetical protein